MSELKKINLKELSGTFEEIPEGDITFKLVDLKHGDSSSGKPMLTAEYRITKGPSRGATFRQWYSLAGKQNDKGKQSYPGLRTIADIYAAIGVEVESLDVEPVAAARSFQRNMKDKEIEGYYSNVVDPKDSTKSFPRVKVYGLSGGSNGTYEVEEDEE